MNELEIFSYVYKGKKGNFFFFKRWQREKDSGRLFNFFQIFFFS